jgi:hypothetical protein
MKVKTETVKTVSITLEGEREIELFAGLVDFPRHFSQPKEIREFLGQLAEEVPDSEKTPERMGYKDETNF